METLHRFLEWFKDPFGRKRLSRKHDAIHQELQSLSGQLTQKKRDLSRNPYRAAHRSYRKKGVTNAQPYQ